MKILKFMKIMFCENMKIMYVSWCKLENMKIM
jgi:hypothetical protein